MLQSMHLRLHRLRWPVYTARVYAIRAAAIDLGEMGVTTASVPTCEISWVTVVVCSGAIGKAARYQNGEDGLESYRRAIRPLCS
jgi:hypothetical protein